MKILLIGEYSGVHATLAEGLRTLGHKVTLASNGDFWKNYPRDINLSRDNMLLFTWNMITSLPRMRNYDIVQLINPMFMELRAERLFTIYRYLRRHNRRIVLAAVGDDFYYHDINSRLRPMRYSDYNIGAKEHHTQFGDYIYHGWVGTIKERLCRHIAADSDAIVAGTYDYWLPYTLTDDIDNHGRRLKEKLSMVPFPFKPAEKVSPPPSEKMRIFIGIQRQRATFKGTDVLLHAAETLKENYPNKVELMIAENVPYAEYCHMMDNSDVMLDQLYSYGPGMNALLTLSKGIITLTGGEPEHYDVMGETTCRPIVNVTPDSDMVYRSLENLLMHPETWAQIKEDSRRYVVRNYDYRKVARQYEQIYMSLLR